MSMRANQCLVGVFEKRGEVEMPVGSICRAAYLVGKLSTGLQSVRGFGFGERPNDVSDDSNVTSLKS